jgi:uncharacterized protein
MFMSLSFLLLLAVLGTLAGFIDSVIGGGGGLVQFAILVVLLPTVPLALLIGTERLSGLIPAVVTVPTYASRARIRWRTVGACAASALFAAPLGAKTVTLLNPTVVKPFVLMVFVAVGIYTLRSKQMQRDDHRRFSGRMELAMGIAVGAVLGFYSGFFGPGTGTFLFFLFASFFGFGVFGASASAKIVDSAARLSAIAYFVVKGAVLYHIALPMALFSVIGAYLGTHVALSRGVGFVKFVFTGVVAVTVTRLAIDILGS